MKFYGTILLALCLYTPKDVWGFQAATPKTIKPSFALHAEPEVGWDNMQLTSPFIRVLGESRRTWQFVDTSREIVQVVMKSEGRPMRAVSELWVGPDWTPVTIKTYSEDGLERPIQTLIGTRNKEANIEIRNVGGYEFPFSGSCAYAEPPLSTARTDLAERTEGRYIEGGGAVYTVNFAADVQQVQVLLSTDKLQLNAKIELLNGPNNVKQSFEIYTNNGLLNSLYVVFNTPGSGNVVRVTNIAPLEFPCKAYMSPV
jgi:hypothetical protein